MELSQNDATCLVACAEMCSNISQYAVIHYNYITRKLYKKDYKLPPNF